MAATHEARSLAESRLHSCRWQKKCSEEKLALENATGILYLFTNLYRRLWPCVRDHFSSFPLHLCVVVPPRFPWGVVFPATVDRSRALCPPLLALHRLLDGFFESAFSTFPLLLRTICARATQTTTTGPHPSLPHSSPPTHPYLFGGHGYRLGFCAAVSFPLATPGGRGTHPHLRVGGQGQCQQHPPCRALERRRRG